jgi:hypothetical protein
MPDLWPSDVGTTDTTPPVTLLKEQATFLGEKTRHLVEGRVVSIEDRPDVPRDHFAYMFYLVGPAIGNYRYKLLTLSYPPEFYPLEIAVDEDIVREPGAITAIRQALEPQAREGRPAQPKAEEGSEDWVTPNPLATFKPDNYFQVKSEEDFRQILKTIFGAKKTRRVIAAIVAQSTS